MAEGPSSRFGGPSAHRAGPLQALEEAGLGKIARLPDSTPVQATQIFRHSKGVHGIRHLAGAPLRQRDENPGGTLVTPHPPTGQGHLRGRFGKPLGSGFERLSPGGQAHACYLSWAWFSNPAAFSSRFTTSGSWSRGRSKQTRAPSVWAGRCLHAARARTLDLRASSGMNCIICMVHPPVCLRSWGSGRTLNAQSPGSVPGNRPRGYPPGADLLPAAASIWANMIIPMDLTRSASLRQGEQVFGWSPESGGVRGAASSHPCSGPEPGTSAQPGGKELARGTVLPGRRFWP